MDSVECEADAAPHGAKHGRAAHEGAKSADVPHEIRRAADRAAQRRTDERSQQEAIAYRIAPALDAADLGGGKGARET